MDQGDITQKQMERRVEKREILEISIRLPVFKKRCKIEMSFSFRCCELLR